MASRSDSDPTRHHHLAPRLIPRPDRSHLDQDVGRCVRLRTPVPGDDPAEIAALLTGHALLVRNAHLVVLRADLDAHSHNLADLTI